MQYVLFRLLQKCQNEVDSSLIVPTILMDLCKAYDYLPHDLIIAKLEAYRLDTNGLKLLFNYLSCCIKQTSKMGTAYSNWSDVPSGVP